MTCENKRAIFTHSINFTGPFGDRHIYTLPLIWCEAFIVYCTQIQKAERLQRWWLKLVVHVPRYTSTLLLKLADLKSIAPEIHILKSLFLGHLINKPKVVLPSNAY